MLLILKSIYSARGRFVHGALIDIDGGETKTM
jgi:hypothetical protein